ncbi:MAG: diadenylate cyclase CdaA [Alistipes sp.]|nr:diadenylate cyclase CdaA [Alistipes sp.]
MGFIPFTFIDFIDILLVAGLLFIVYKAMKGTNAPYIMVGIVMVYLAWVIVKALNMELLSTILGQIISVGVIALLVIFQPELRRFLFTLGMRQKELDFLTRFFSLSRKHSSTNTSPFVSACMDMSEEKVGALIVFRRKDDLQFVIESGIALDANIGVSLIKNIFFKNAPLHDGAVVIDNNRIVAAKCILPVTQSNVPKSYGTRHRAAIGLSEMTDAVVLVVSEETGNISIVKGGKVKSKIDPQKLNNALKQALEEQEESPAN